MFEPNLGLSPPPTSALLIGLLIKGITPFEVISTIVLLDCTLRQQSAQIVKQGHQLLNTLEKR